MDWFIKEYKDIIIHTNYLKFSTKHKPTIGWEKYISEKKTFITGIPQRVDKLKSIYSITPIVSELEVDKEIYEHYMKNYLEDE